MKREQVAEAVNRELKTFFEEYTTSLPPPMTGAREMTRLLQEFCLRGGKRLRPYLVVCGHQLVADQPLQQLLPLALVPELLHAFLLIHDDIMDQGTLRHGALSLNASYTQELAGLGYLPQPAQRGGMCLALLAGDLSCALMLRVISRLEVPPALYRQLLHLISSALAATIYGQELDMRFESRRGVSSPEVLAMYHLKTATYTFDLPLQLGATLGKASAATLVLLHTYALACGAAFQIQDDILGIFGEEEHTGKAAGADIQQGKKTLLITKALELAPKADRSFLLQVLGSSPEQSVVAEVQRIVTASGARAACEEVARQHIGEAQEALALLPAGECNAAAITALAELTYFIRERAH